MHFPRPTLSLSKTRRVDSTPISEVTPFTSLGHQSSWMNDSYPFCLMSISPPIPEIHLFENFILKINGRYHACGQSYLKVWPWTSKVKVMTQGQNWWLHLRSIVQLICSFFVSCQSYQFVMGYVNFSFQGNWINLPWDTFIFHFMAISSICDQMQWNPYLTLKIQGKGHGQFQTQWSHLRPIFQSICMLFVSWKLDHFWPKYSKLHIWSWKFKVKVKVKVVIIINHHQFQIDSFNGRL